jgi:hypothetical protein
MSLLVRKSNVYYGGAKRRKRRVRRRGAGLFSSIGNALSKANNWLKSNKIISTVGSALAPALPIAGTIAKGAAALGYGRRRRVGRPRKAGRPRKGRGGNLRSLLASAHKFIKDKKLVSSALSHFGHNKLSAGASALGYGRRRRRVGRPVKRRRVVRRTVRRHRGGANFFSTEQISAPKF